MSDDDARRRHPAGDDTFDDLFPARAGHPDDGRERARRPLRSSPDDPTQAVPAGRAARRTESVRRPQAPAAEVGSPPPPRGAGLLLPWIIITASVLAIGIVGFMVLRGQRTHPNTAATTPAVTRTVTQTQTPTATASTSSSVRTPATTSSASTPPAASTPPPGFTKCAGTDTGYKVSGSGTTCSFVADVAQKATAAAGQRRQRVLHRAGGQHDDEQVVHAHLHRRGVLAVHHPAGCDQAQLDIDLRHAWIADRSPRTARQGRWKAQVRTRGRLTTCPPRRPASDGDPGAFASRGPG